MASLELTLMMGRFGEIFPARLVITCRVWQIELHVLGRVCDWLNSRAVWGRAPASGAGRKPEPRYVHIYDFVLALFNATLFNIITYALQFFCQAYKVLS